MKNIFSDCRMIRISHIGSSAVKEIYSKDIIDVLAETEDIEKTAELAEKNGFIRMSSASERITLNMGCSPENFADKVYHLHIRKEGDNNELCFRDYLNDNPDVAEEHEALKLSLQKKYEHNRDAYIDAKSEFVRKYTEKAKLLYKNGY